MFGCTQCVAPWRAETQNICTWTLVTGNKHFFSGKLKINVKGTSLRSGLVTQNKVAMLFLYQQINYKILKNR